MVEGVGCCIGHPLCRQDADQQRQQHAHIIAHLLSPQQQLITHCHLAGDVSTTLYVHCCEFCWMTDAVNRVVVLQASTAASTKSRSRMNMWKVDAEPRIIFLCSAPALSTLNQLHSAERSRAGPLTLPNCYDRASAQRSSHHCYTLLQTLKTPRIIKRRDARRRREADLHHDDG